MDYTVLIGSGFTAELRLVSWPLLNLWGGDLRNGLNGGETCLLARSAGLVPVILGGIAAFGQIVNLVRPGKKAARNRQNSEPDPIRRNGVQADPARQSTISSFTAPPPVVYCQRNAP